MPDSMLASWNHRHRLGQTAEDARYGVFNPHHSTAAVRMRGPLDIAALTAAWLDVQRRHPALTCAFDIPALRLLIGAWAPADPVLLAGTGDDLDLATLRDACTEPFDLSAGPLARLVVVDRGPADAYLALVTEHLVSDGWSLNVLMRDLGSRYGHYLGRPQPELSTASNAWFKFIDQQNRFVASPAGQAALDRVAARLAVTGPIPAMPIPGFRPCDRIRYECKQIVPRTVDAGLYADMAVVARSARLSKLSLMHAALHRALFELSGRAQVATTLSTANRENPVDRNAVGWYASKTVVVSSPGRYLTTDDYLRHFRGQVFQALDAAAVPWPATIDRMDAASVGRQARTPYVTFNARPLGMRTNVGAAEFPGLETSPLPILVGWHDAAIATFWDESDTGVTVTIIFKTDWYDARAVTDLWDALESTLRSWAASPR